MTMLRIFTLALLASVPLARRGAEGTDRGVPCAVVQGQEQEEEVADDRDEVKELLQQLVGHTGRLGKEDALAVQVIGKLRGEFAHSGPHDRRKIASGLYRAMKVRRRTSSDGHRLRELFFVTAKAMGEMGPETVEYLIRLIDDRNHADDLEVQVRVLDALGRTQDERAVDPLLDVLDEFQSRLQAAAAEALGNFAGLDQKVRKRAFEELLKLLTGTRSALDSEPDSSTLRERWGRIAGPTQNSLRRLSGADVSGAPGWRRWWNKNKRRDWDES